MGRAAMFDRKRLATALERARRARGKSWREVASEIGVQPSTLTRLHQGANPSVEGFARMATWLGVSADSFIRW